MRAPSAAELLSAWELGLDQSPARRALTLLEAACTTVDGSPSELAVGERDARLFRLRELVFGPELVALAECPGCDEPLELTLRVSDLCAGGEPDAVLDAGPDELVLEADGVRVDFRPPQAADLAAVFARDAGEARAALLERCVLRARRNGDDLRARDLPAPVVDALVARMAAADPRAELELALACPACTAEWRRPFDIASFLWSEVDAWAQHLLRDVHALAAAYGWSESKILTLGPRRRAFYRGLVGA